MKYVIDKATGDLREKPSKSHLEVIELLPVSDEMAKLLKFKEDMDEMIARAFGYS